MANFVFNIAKGRWVQWAQNVNDRVPSNSAFIWIPINTTASDATLRDLTTVTAVLGATTTSDLTASAWTGAARVVQTACTIVVDNTNDQVTLDSADVTFGTTVTGSTASTDVLLAYDGDTTSGTDANLIPIAIFDWAYTPQGGITRATTPTPYLIQP